MTPEAGHFLEKARRLLGEARAMLAVGLNEAAGRSAYLAGYHAAQAFIVETTGKSVRTHKGVQIELHRLTRDQPGFDPQLRVFLSQSYNMKAIADYETGPDAVIPAERVADALRVAGRFVVYFEQLLSEG